MGGSVICRWTHQVPLDVHRVKTEAGHGAGTIGEVRCPIRPGTGFRWAVIGNPKSHPMSLRFERYVGINYSDAQTPASSLKGLRVYIAECSNAPQGILPPPGPHKYWTRRGIAEWLARLFSEHTTTLVGIDHRFSFPLRYFEQYGLPLDWPSFLDDFQYHSRTDRTSTSVLFWTAASVTLRRVLVIHAGDASRNFAHAWRNPCSSSKFRGK